MTRSVPRLVRRGSTLCSAAVLAACAGTALAATIPPALLALRPVKAVSYQPSPSDDCAWQQKHCPTPPPPPAPQDNPAYFDSDFFNTDFVQLWGQDGAGNGRNDLATIKAAGVNLLHLYSWNPQRSHRSFLDAVAAKGMRAMIPITNYTACTISGNCQGIQPGQASYQTAFNIIKGTFDEIYGGGTTPHAAAAVWAIYNEYDYNDIDPKNVVFAIQAILTLEAQNNVPAASRLPIVVPMSYGTDVDKPQQWFRDALALYQKMNPGAGVPGGVLPVVALSVAMQNANANNTTSYKAAGDAQPITVAALPANFWQTRFIATINPFSDGPALNAYVTSANGFQSAFPGADTTAGGVTWKAAWNSLPPLFFSESGVNISGSASPPSAGTPQTQASFILRQLQCTMPWAADATSTPQGYFLGTTIFEFTNEDANGRWGMHVFPSPLNYTTAQTTSNQTYRVDTLVTQPAWANVATGFAATIKSCQ